MKDPKKSFGVALLAVTLAFSFAACGNPAAGSTDPVDLSGYIVISPQSNIKTGDMLTAAYVGTETVQYQWNMGNSPVPGATAPLFFPEIGGYYTVTVSASGYNSMKSDPITVTQGSSQPFGGVLSVTPAGTATVGTTLTAMYTGSESGRTFQWYKDSAPLTGNTSASYTPTVAGNYFVVMSATGYISKVSNGVTVTVASNPGGGGNNNPGGGNPSLDQGLVGKWYSTAAEAAKTDGDVVFEISSSGALTVAGQADSATFTLTTSGGKISAKITMNGTTVDGGTANYELAGGTKLRLSNATGTGPLVSLKSGLDLAQSFGGDGYYHKGTTGSGGTDNPGGGSGNNGQFLGTWTGYVTLPDTDSYGPYGGMAIPYTLIISQTGFTTQMEMVEDWEGSGTYTVSGNNITFYIDGGVVGNGALANGTLTFTDPRSDISGTLTKSSDNTGTPGNGGNNNPGGGNPSLDQGLVAKWYSTATEAAKPNGNAVFEITSSGELKVAGQTTGTTFTVTTSGGKISAKINTSGMTVDAGTADYTISGGTKLRLSNATGTGPLVSLKSGLDLAQSFGGDGYYHKGTTGSGGSDNPGNIYEGGEEFTSKALRIIMPETICQQARGGYAIGIFPRGTTTKQIINTVKPTAFAFSDYLDDLYYSKTSAISEGIISRAIPLHTEVISENSYIGYSGTGDFDIYVVLYNENREETRAYVNYSVPITSEVTTITITEKNIIDIPNLAYLGWW